VDVFLPNRVEIQGITGSRDVEEGIRKLENGRTLVVGKLGEEGCIAWYGRGWIRVSAFPVEVVDTTGAGDSFNAGFLHTWLRGEKLADCLRFAAACGALSTRGLGGTATQASEEEVHGYFHAQARH
jgi:sugar/nucleoside kinase (ribokinase family)